jgi:NAD(P) transhydrogenase
VLHLTGMSMRHLYGESYRVKHDITVQDLLARTQHVIGREIEVVASQLFRNHVDLFAGTGSFTDPHTVAVDGGDRGDRRLVTAHRATT